MIFLKSISVTLSSLLSVITKSGMDLDGSMAMEAPSSSLSALTSVREAGPPLVGGGGTVRGGTFNEMLTGLVSF